MQVAIYEYSYYVDSSKYVLIIGHSQKTSTRVATKCTQTSYLDVAPST